MSDVRFAKLTSAELAGTAIIDGQLLFCTDTQKIYLDTGNTRVMYGAEAPYNDLATAIATTPSNSTYAGIGAIQGLHNEIDTRNSHLKAQVAPQYSNTQTWAVGDYCVQNNYLYRCKTAITTPEAFNGAKWDLVTIGGELKSNANSIANVNSSLSNSISLLNLRAGTLETELDNVTGGTSDIKFLIGEDGKPYIQYKVGADTVVKKLGSAELSVVATCPVHTYATTQGSTSPLSYTIPADHKTVYIGISVSDGYDDNPFKSSFGGTVTWSSLYSRYNNTHSATIATYLHAKAILDPQAGQTVIINHAGQAVGDAILIGIG